MRINFRYIFLLVFALISFKSIGGSVDTLKTISQTNKSLPDSLINTIIFKNDEKDNGNFHVKINAENEGIEYNPKWLLFNYDLPEIRFTTFNDTGYSVIDKTNILQAGYDITGGKKQFHNIPFKGIAWYKIYFKMPAGQINSIYNFIFTQLGASEIYLDGKLLKTYGKIDKDGKTKQAVHTELDFVNYFIADTLPHTIAIRYSCSDFEMYRDKYEIDQFGPEIGFLDFNDTISKFNYFNVLTNVTNMLAAFFFALFLIHLLIYLFYKEKSFNLLYSLFLLFLSICFLEVYLNRTIENAHFYLWLSSIDGIFFPACCVFLVTLLNKLLNIKPTKHYKFFIVIFILLVIDVFFFNLSNGFFSIMIVFYTYFNTLAHAIKGIKRNIPSSKFLGWGVLSFTLSIVLSIVLSIIISLFATPQTNNNLVIITFSVLIIIAILSIPLSMTAYLAYDFARTNRNLVDQLQANDALNKKSLEQEKEKQELLSNQNRMLETQVAQRTKEIAEQNKQLEHQKKEITDSITYAKRIQQALLPELSEIKAKLPTSFIYYMPKDIVSGDFYFFQSFNSSSDHPGRTHVESENGVFIAAADCTGHGVPGALMSMIVHEKLESATRIFNQPKDILKSINQQVKDALKQYQNENASRDGCDIALLKLVGNKLSYSGAYRPLYYFDKNNTFNEIKPTKTAIAGLTPYDQQFDQSELDTNDLKAVYVFSDGFADQFGGEKVKKLTTKKFKELLARIMELPAEVQKAELDTFFTQWKGNVEQIDDVLVIGITF